MSTGQLAVGPLRGSGHGGSKWEAFIPKSIVCIREGYGRQFLVNDLLAGLTVGVIALPLAMALAIASGVEPERGLFTAIIAGGIISCLSGSRVLVAGPTAAFVSMVLAIVQKHGYDGLCIATIMAGGILILLGLFKFGGMIKFIPYPVTTGFTAGIALLIFSTQVPEFIGIDMKLYGSPSGFVERWAAYWVGRHAINWYALGIGAGGLAIIIGFRRFAPRIPGALVAVVLASVAVSAFNLEKYGVQTIGTRFPAGIPRSLPRPTFPTLSKENLKRAKALIPEATTIALLAAIESLLCAVVADGMIGGRHKSNCELVAQGVGNIAAIIFGGIPATGAIARTAANVKSGGRTPVAGVVHAVTLLLFMFLLAPYARYVPLAVLAAILMVVAYGMSEKDHFTHLLKAPRSDILVLLTTFGLTVLTDLTIAVGVGMVLASLLFMKRMSEVTNVGAIAGEGEDVEELTDEGDPNALSQREVPDGVEVFEINGPFFFGVADRLKDTLRGLERPPKVFILRMRRVPAIDATGMHALDEFYDKCHKQRTVLLFAGIHAQPIFAITNYGLIDKFGEENLYGNIDDALNRAREIVGAKMVEKPASAVAEVAREKN